ncbi:MAG: cysteine desulfurase [Bdellovibrionaceae bacterium]|nr:cysteine desulfurase [Pseudobdellovibrionaceae bacterium]
MKRPIYLDFNATTPMDPLVLDAMLPYLKDEFGNASSNSHEYGWEASRAVSNSRKSIAEKLGALSKEIIFTSGATESNNLAILGVMHNFRNHRSHIITSEVEHKAVLDVVKSLEAWGVEVTYLKVDKYGRVSPADVGRAIKPHTRLISIMTANNEIGTINPIKEIAELAKHHGVFFHTDAAQAFGKVPLDVKNMAIDMLSISGHKIYGPKGVGVLYVRSQKPQVHLHPQQFGGGQEWGLRPGTLNVPGIVGIAKAIDLMFSNHETDSTHLLKLQKKMIETVLQKVNGSLLNGHPEERIYNNVSFSFPNLSADMFSLGLNGLAVSSGSACSSAEARPSYVLTAIGHSDALARATLRVGLGRTTTDEEVDICITKILQLSKKSQEIGH